MNTADIINFVPPPAQDVAGITVREMDVTIPDCIDHALHRALLIMSELAMRLGGAPEVIQAAIDQAVTPEIPECVEV